MFDYRTLFLYYTRYKKQGVSMPSDHRLVSKEKHELDYLLWKWNKRQTKENREELASNLDKFNADQSYKPHNRITFYKYVDDYAVKEQLDSNSSADNLLDKDSSEASNSPVDSAEKPLQTGQNSEEKNALEEATVFNTEIENGPDLDSMPDLEDEPVVDEPVVMELENGPGLKIVTHEEIDRSENIDNDLSDTVADTSPVQDEPDITIEEELVEGSGDFSLDEELTLDSDGTTEIDEPDDEDVEVSLLDGLDDLNNDETDEDFEKTELLDPQNSSQDLYDSITTGVEEPDITIKEELIEEETDLTFDDIQEHDDVSNESSREDELFLNDEQSPVDEQVLLKEQTALTAKPAIKTKKRNPVLIMGIIILVVIILLAAAYAVPRIFNPGSEVAGSTTSTIQQATTLEDPDIIKGDKLLEISALLIENTPVYFKENQAVLLDGESKKLEAISQTISNCKKIRLVIHGHAANVQQPRHERRLSIKRAKLVKSYLQKNSTVTSLNIDIEGHGSRYRKSDDNDRETMHLDRRVEIHVISAE
jgi:outer membrane protein OmpA-like peptidoglycan-associated protein